MIKQNSYKILGILMLILLFVTSSFAEEGKTSPANTPDSKPQLTNEPNKLKNTDPDCPPSAAKSIKEKPEDPFQTLTPPLRMMEGDLAGEG
jgi:hypothetical protein